MRSLRLLTLLSLYQPWWRLMLLSLAHRVRGGSPGCIPSYSPGGDARLLAYDSNTNEIGCLAGAAQALASHRNLSRFTLSEIVRPSSRPHTHSPHHTRRLL